MESLSLKSMLKETNSKMQQKEKERITEKNEVKERKENKRKKNLISILGTEHQTP